MTQINWFAQSYTTANIKPDIMKQYGIGLDKAKIGLELVSGAGKAR
jgi:hypothetical protein